jgi:diaminohydroxyphosphoribosylaminopyrimidine deaminase/5-amino-6-(5-phosphoribosylamino)uracil reductase
LVSNDEKYQHIKLYFCIVNTHEDYIRRCIELAKNGLGTTYPNPMVGSVIVHNNTIIGEGWHKKSGKPHAEVNAIKSVKNKTLLSESTIYVSLEPCCHFGKTPPCTDLILEYNIPNIVIGSIDPNEKVAGKGIQKLKDAGKNVLIGVLQHECLALNKRFFTFHNKSRPYIILKWAESQDGFIAPAHKNEKKPVWITNIYSRQLVHKWRSEEQSILVGTSTVLEDNPKLDVRDWYGNSPLKVIIDLNNKINDDYFVAKNRTHSIFISQEDKNIEKENMDLPEFILSTLYRKNIQSVIIEGGATTLQYFIDKNLWDEARIFKGRNFFKKGIKAPHLYGETKHSTTVCEDQLLIIENHD